MKKIILLLFIVLLGMALSACGGDGQPPVEEVFDTTHFDSYVYLPEPIEIRGGVIGSVRAAWTQDERIYLYHIIFDVRDGIPYGSTIAVTSFLPSGRRGERQEFPGDVAGWEAFHRAYGAFLPEEEQLVLSEAAVTPPDGRLVGLGHALSAWEDAAFDLLLDDGRYLFGYNPQTGVRTPILNWLETGLADLQNTHILFLDDGRIFVLSQSAAGQDGYTTEFFILTPAPRVGGQPERITITLGGVFLSPQITAAAHEFNRESHTHYIEVIDYVEDGWEVSTSRFQADILAGRGPDLIYGADEAMADADLLLDLYPFLDADRTLNHSDFFPNVLAAFESPNGTLPSIANRFGIHTMIAQTETVGHIDVWTVSALLTLIEEVPVPYPLGFWADGPHLISTVLSSFIDWRAMEANFDSDLFLRALESSRRWPSFPPLGMDWDDWNPEFVSPFERMLQGEQLLSMAFLFGADNYRSYPAALGDITALGMPTAAGGVHEIMFTTNRVGISAETEHAAAAWSFIRQLLLPRSHNVDGWSFPLRIDLYEAQIAAFMDAQMIERWEGDFQVDILAMTEAEVQSLRAIIDSAKPGGHFRFDSDLWEIMMEELLPFFAGESTAEDTARVIQDRVQGYLAERSR